MPTRHAITKQTTRSADRLRAAGRTAGSDASGSGLRASLRRAIRRFYDCYRQEKWTLCFNRIDPQLRAAAKVDFDSYRELLQTFLREYGDVSILVIEVSEIHRSKHDPRPFAFASIVWRDRSHEFHVFRERWVFDGRRWYTRVVGLVTHQQPSAN